jgi:hypothetical protein
MLSNAASENRLRHLSSNKDQDWAERLKRPEKFFSGRSLFRRESVLSEKNCLGYFLVQD